MKDFLVEISTTVPEGTDPAEVARRRAAEAVRAGELAAAGNLFRLWRPEGELRSIGVWRADSEEELYEKVLGTLPLRPWMSLTVTALVSHPNDPGARRHDPRSNELPATTQQETSVSGTEASTMTLEIQIIPVSDVDRVKKFYEQLGWRFDDDVAPFDGLRIVQFTPPGSGASITFGKGLTTSAPGSAAGGLVVSDIEAAHAELTDRGIDVSEIWHGPPFPVEARQPGPDPERTSYGSFCAFTDPDGNVWIVQEVTTRLPGRVE